METEVCNSLFFCVIIWFVICFFFFFSSRRRHTRSYGDWSSDVCSSDLGAPGGRPRLLRAHLVPARGREARAQPPAGAVQPLVQPAPRDAARAALSGGAARRGEADPLHDRGDQIGRASCRERGEIAVPAG